jgi:hypothetical protein
LKVSNFDLRNFYLKPITSLLPQVDAVVDVQDIRLTWLQRATKRVLDLALAGLGLLLQVKTQIVFAMCLLRAIMWLPEVTP